MSTEKQARCIRYRFTDYIIIILALFFMSCAKNYKSGDCAYNYTISVGNNISIKKSEAEIEFLSVLKQSQVSRNSVEIVIFSYSSGKEVFFYSDDYPDNILTNTHAGRIEALIKIKQDNYLGKVLFINATGNSRKEILHRLAIASREALCGY